MRKINLINLVILLVLFCACTKQDHNEGGQSSPSPETSTNLGILKFNSADELFMQINKLRDSENFNIDQRIVTRSIENSSDFVSLQEALIAQGLAEFTEEELREISENELVYEPVDEIIIDPYFASILNTDREVLVNDKIYKYIEAGVLEFEPTPENILFVNNYDFDDTLLDLEHGASTFLNSFVKLTRISYQSPQTQEPDFPDQFNVNWDGSLTLLSDKHHIPKQDVKIAAFKKGSSDANWLQREVISAAFGTNVVLENYFDSRHRMKMSMYNQDYILFRSVGMSVRMQERLFRIWWRKKAQEFRYGWTAIEVEYKYDNPVFGPAAPPTLENPVARPKYPPLIEKQFPYANKKIILGQVPIANYNITSGDINTVFREGVKELYNKIKSYLTKDENKTKPLGLYSVGSNDKLIYVVYPQGEDKAYNDGRENIHWAMDWFSGNFVLVFGSSNGSSWSTDVKDISHATKTTIKRGQVYSAVKYDNKWKACVIKTE